MELDSGVGIDVEEEQQEEEEGMGRRQQDGAIDTAGSFGRLQHDEGVEGGRPPQQEVGNEDVCGMGAVGVYSASFAATMGVTGRVET